MAPKQTLTNQKLSERFDNAFTLVNYAIGIARNLIARGEELSDNPINLVLDAIAENRDLELQEKKVEVKNPYEDFEEIEEEVEEKVVAHE